MKGNPMARNQQYRWSWLTSMLFTLWLQLPGGMAMAQKIDVWLGTGRSAYSKGIYHSTFDAASGKLTDPTLVAEMEGPGFLAKHPKLPVLYAVGNLNKTDVVAAFAIEKTGGKSGLRPINSLPIGDGGAAHVSLDQTGKMLFTAQYGAGSLGVFSVADDGAVKARTQLIKHEGGSKVVADRQNAPHAHWTGTSPDNRFVFVPDLGLDQVVVYAIDPDKNEVKKYGAGVTPPGSGPRHMKFHNNGKWIYVLNELSLTVTVFDYDSEMGTMTAKQTIEAVPAAELALEKAKSASEIRVHPNGKFVYSANRGHDTITVFRVNADNGMLEVVQRANARAVTPRNFALTGDGRWLLAAGQASHTLSVFGVDPQSGRMTFDQHCVHVPSPICVLPD
jgi:6-phosphogluconolactonase